jgi:trigger factor
MSNIVREDVEKLTAVLTVTVEEQDYKPKFKSELNTYRKKANMKGFRKGRTPMSVVRKMYGKAVLADVVNRMIQEELVRYLREEDIDILAQPLPSEDQPPIDFDLKELHDFEFKFEVGLAPKFEVKGVSEEDTFKKYTVEITDEMVDKELDNARKRHGERVYSEEEIKEEDLLRLRAVELADGEVKVDGVESTFNLLIESIDDEAVKKEILSKKVGDKLRLNLFELEKNTDADYVRKYFLNLEQDDDREVGEEYEVTIEEASHIEPAEFDQEFFDKEFEEGEVTNEEEAREKIRENIREYYDNQAGALLYRDFQEYLMEQNEIPLPDDFLLRWLKASNESIPEEEVEKEYDNFAKNLKWSLIRSKLMKEFKINVKSEEIVDQLKNRVRSYFGGVPGNDELIESMAQRLMQDEKQRESAYEDILADKLHEAIEERVTIEPQPVAVEEFEEIIEQARAEAEQRRSSAAEEE